MCSASVPQLHAHRAKNGRDDQTNGGSGDENGARLDVEAVSMRFVFILSLPAARISRVKVQSKPLQQSFLLSLVL